MPRIAIKDYDTSFFHVMVQGIRKEYIFDTNEDKEVYLNLMHKYLNKFEVKIIAYCVMSNHAHMLIYVQDKKQLSEYMRAINTTYAMYHNKKYKNVGYVFRNRYKVEPIYGEKHLINCIHYIHNNPVKAKVCNKMEEYKYLSYREYLYNTGKIIRTSKQKFKEINNLFINEINEINEDEYNYMDYEEIKELLDKKEIIEEYLDKNKIDKLKIKLDSEKLKEISKKLNEKCGMTHQEIADEFGVNRIKITRLINSD